MPVSSLIRPLFAARPRLGPGYAAAVLLCAMAVPASAQKELTIAVAATPLSLPIYVAHDQGYFADEGLKPRWAECLGSFRCLRLLFAGEVDLATVTDAAVMFGSFERTDYSVLATFVKVPDDLKLVARRSAGITAPQHLAGKRIGVVWRSASHFFFDAYLLVNGVDPKSVIAVGMAPEDLVDALATGKVDAISTWEPLGHEASARLGADVVLLTDPGVYSETFNLVASRRLTGTHDADLAKLLRAIHRGERFIRARPEQAKAILRARLKTEPAVVDWIWRSPQFRLTLEQSLLRTLEAQARWAMRSGHVWATKAPNYLNFVHAAPLRSVDDEAVSLPR